jgi:hypothetical protein
MFTECFDKSRFPFSKEGGGREGAGSTKGVGEAKRVRVLKLESDFPP